MFQNLELFKTSYAMARHAGARQAVTAANLANADTPGYRARSIAPFSESFDAAPMANLRATRPSHLAPSPHSSSTKSRMSDGEASPNGNSVSVEQEMINAVEVQREHRRALAIYKHGLDVLRTSIGRR